MFGVYIGLHTVFLHFASDDIHISTFVSRYKSRKFIGMRKYTYYRFSDHFYRWGRFILHPKASAWDASVA